MYVCVVTDGEYLPDVPTHDPGTPPRSKGQIGASSPAHAYDASPMLSDAMFANHGQIPAGFGPVSQDAHTDSRRTSTPQKEKKREITPMIS